MSVTTSNPPAPGLSSSPTQVELRPIASAEIPQAATQIAQMHARLFNPGWQAAALQDLLMRHAATSLVATRCSPTGSAPDLANDENHANDHVIDDVLAGFIVGRIAADEAEIITIGVAPELQQHGLGRRLLQALIERLKAQGAKRLVLEVAATNAGALALYQSSGFSQVGRRNNYYAGGGGGGGKPQNALVMALDL